MFNSTLQYLPSFDPDDDEKNPKVITRHVAHLCWLGGIVPHLTRFQWPSQPFALNVPTRVLFHCIPCLQESTRWHRGASGTEWRSNGRNRKSHVRTQHRPSLRITDLTRRRSTPVSTDLTSLQEELSDILSSVADLSNKLVAKVVGYRSEQHAQLDLPNFLAFFNQSWDFVIRCEVICRRMIMGLRGTILSQVGLCLHFLLHYDWSLFRLNYSCKLSTS